MIMRYNRYYWEKSGSYIWSDHDRSLVDINYEVMLSVRGFASLNYYI